MSEQPNVVKDKDGNDLVVVPNRALRRGRERGLPENRLDRLREWKAVQQHGDEGKAPKTPI